MFLKKISISIILTFCFFDFSFSQQVLSPTFASSGLEINESRSLKVVATFGEPICGVVKLDKYIIIEGFYAFANTATGVSNPKKVNLKIYPNPAKDFFNIVNTTNNKLKITIYNISGAFVKTLWITPHDTLVINDLKTGVYAINVSGGNENTTYKQIIL